jgi:metal-responsive CopG/Arc/MetJ family transcriptional regulator
MVRTQIYLDDSQKDQLEKISRRTKSSMAELIRDAVDRYLEEERKSPDESFLNAFGIWKDRKESGTAYVKRVRKEWLR